MGSSSGWQAKNSEPEASPFRRLIDQTLQKPQDAQNTTSTIPKLRSYGWTNTNGQESGAGSIFNQVLTNNSGLRISQALGDSPGFCTIQSYPRSVKLLRLASPELILFITDNTASDTSNFDILPRFYGCSHNCRQATFGVWQVQT